MKIALLGRVNELLSYDMKTGVFTWKVSRKRNQVKAGSVAGSTMKNGYICIGIDGTKYYAHRLAWFVATGKFPEKEIDHADGNKTNNSISNLREALHFENSQNTKRPTNNTSGYTGVSWQKSNSKWFAYVSCKGERVSGGFYEKKEDAIIARKILKERMHIFNPHEQMR